MSSLTVPVTLFPPVTEGELRSIDATLGVTIVRVADFEYGPLEAVMTTAVVLFALFDSTGNVAKSFPAGTVTVVGSDIE